MADGLDQLSQRLVLLDDRPLSALEAEFRDFEAALLRHCGADRRGCPETQESRSLASDHERFREAAEQLEWFVEILRTEDHGGHRQAAGQYGQVLVEALREHLARERRLAEWPRSPAGAPPVSK